MKQESNTPRGAMTNEAKAIYKAAGLGKLTTRKLRLMPYLQFKCVNSQGVNPAQITQEEREIIAEWRDAGHLDDPPREQVIMSRVFWDAVCAILFSTYANK